MRTNELPKVKLEYCNGERFNPELYMRKLASTQDLEAWRDSGKSVEVWLKGELLKMLESVHVNIEWPTWQLGRLEVAENESEDYDNRALNSTLKRINDVICKAQGVGQ